MYSFIPAIKYVDDCVELFLENKEQWIDDYWPASKYLMIAEFMKELSSDWFFAITKEDKFLGFVWLVDWQGRQGKYNSVQIQGMMTKQAQGKITQQAFDQLLNELFNKIGLKRIQMEIPDYNKPACYLATRMGFKLDGIIRKASAKDNKPVNYKLYSILDNEYNGVLING